MRLVAFLLAMLASDTQSGEPALRLVAAPVVVSGKPFVIATVANVSEKVVLVGNRMQLNGSGAEPDRSIRDVWYEVKDERGRFLEWRCQGRYAGFKSTWFVPLKPHEGIATVLGFDCYAMAVGHRYDVTVHLRWTPEEARRPKAGAFLDELVAPPVTITVPANAARGPK